MTNITCGLSASEAGDQPPARMVLEGLWKCLPYQ